MSTCTYLTCKVAGDSPANGGTGAIRLLEAPAPLPGVDRAVRVQVAGVDERLDAPLVLVVLQVVHLLQRQLPVVVQIQVAEHPLGLRLAGGREVGLRLLAVLAPLLAVGHDHREPVQQPVANRRQLLRLALRRLRGVGCGGMIIYHLDYNEKRSSVLDNIGFLTTKVTFGS